VPTYEYLCAACEHRFEEFQSMSDRPLLKCPECGRRKLRRLFGTGSGVIFKGSGFYETDYKRKSPSAGSDKGPGGDGKKEPGASSDKAGKPEAKPSGGKSKPSGGESKTSGGESKPSRGESNPAGDGGNPKTR